MTRRLGRAAVFVAVLLLTAGFDQGSKQWAKSLPVSPAGCDVPAELVAHRCAGVPVPVIAGHWDWELAMNPGAAFSSFAGADHTQLVLSLIALIALVGIGVLAARTRPDQRLQRVALALIAGGALGNLIDRVRDGAVTDFVRWRWNAQLWPIFNVADVALVVGVGLLVLDGARERLRGGGARRVPAA